MTSNTLPRIGVLGGMGPLATADFLAKLAHATPAGRDQDHFPVTVESAPQIPDRIAALEGRGEDPLPALVAVALRLAHAGCAVIAMPCNTAHVWYDQLCAQSTVRILHIADAVAARLGNARNIGLIGTTATLTSGLFQQRIGGGHLHWLIPTDEEMSARVMPGVGAVKRGQMAQGAALLLPAVQGLADRGAEVLVLACTEIPLVITAADLSTPVVDATAALAQATIAHAIGLRGGLRGGPPR